MFLLRRTVMIGLVTFVGESVNDYKRSAAVFLLVCVYLVFHILIPPFVYAQDNNLQVEKGSANDAQLAHECTSAHHTAHADAC